MAGTFRHAAFTPVYTTTTIEVDGAGLTASRTYDIASVCAYMLQQGGGGLTCTVDSCYGCEGLTIANAAQATCTLSVTEGDKTLYYAEAAEKRRSGSALRVREIAAQVGNLDKKYFRCSSGRRRASSRRNTSGFTDEAW